MADPAQKTDPQAKRAQATPSTEHNEPAPIPARIDAPHPVRLVGSQKASSASQPNARADEGNLQAEGQQATSRQAPEAEALPLVVGDPLASQAADLAQQLTEQQAELDRRAEAVAAQEADLENKLRTARMWFDEQHNALEEKTEAIEQRESSLDDPANSQPSNVAASEAASDDTQLAEALQERQQELDLRQAELYEQIEQLTSDRARLAERESQLDARQQEIEKKSEEIAAQHSESREAMHAAKAQAADAERQAAELQVLKEEVEDQTADIAVRETQLESRQAEVAAAIKRFEGLGVTEQRIAELTEQAQQFAARTRYLDEAETLLGEEQATIADERRQLQAERQKTQEDFVSERRRIEAERADAKKLAAHNEQLATARSTQLDQRQAALEQLQSELEAGQREVLEMRLATEETWAQLAGALAPATLTRSIAQVRAKLADQYQHTLQKLADRRQELENVSAELAAEHNRLDEQRSRLQLWAGRREEDIEQRAARLVGREHELDRQQRHYEQLETRWALERDEYRDQIRQLLSETRKNSLRAAA